jgi:UDP-2,3-diacylglucosamine pyrophosphatase LpxH
MPDVNELVSPYSLLVRYTPQRNRQKPKGMSAMPTEYFFISDMHIGGDGELENCDFEMELIDFLKHLERKDDAELIINGDAFGLWEFTTLEGMEKLEALIEQQSGLFEQFKATGSKIPITIMPGNHDYELACYPECVDRLREYNLNLVQEVSITREVAGKKVWIEHGQQHDERNHMPEFGNPYAEPVGYFVTAGIVGTAGRYSEFGRGNWLKDVQAVMPITDIPTWMISNYFYREMGPLLRLILLPFLLLFSLGFLVLLSWLLQAVGIFDFNLILDNPLTHSLGITGEVLRAVLLVEGILALLLFLAAIPAAIPLGLLYRDVRKTLERYHVFKPKTPAKEADAPYLEAAREVFEHDPDVAVFVYGHTHFASLKELDRRVVINTGTWLKLPKKVPVLFGQLPPVYRPLFRLNYFKIAEEDGQVAIHYERIEKKPPSELTWTQRLLTFTRRLDKGAPIPARTLVSSNSQEDSVDRAGEEPPIGDLP